MRATTPLVALAFLTAGACFDSLAAQAQPQLKRPLTHDDYDAWQSIGSRAISADGSWIAYRISEQRGDAELVVKSVDGETEWRHDLGASSGGGRGFSRRFGGGGGGGGSSSSPSFTADGKHVIFKVEPSYMDRYAKRIDDLIKSEKKSSGSSSRGRGRPETKGEDDKKGKDELKSYYALMELSTGAVTKLSDDVRSFRVTQDSGAFLVLDLEAPKKDDQKKDDKESEKGEAKKPVEGKGENAGAKKEGTAKEGTEKASAEKKESAKGDDKPAKKKPKKYLKDGTPLVIRDLAKGKEMRLEGVVSWGIADEAGWLWFARNAKDEDSKVERGLFALRLGTERIVKLVDGAADYRSVSFSNDQKHMAFYSNRSNRDAEDPEFDIYWWDFDAPAAKRIISKGNADFPEGRTIDVGRLSFSRDGGVISFGAESPEPEEMPKLLDDEKVVVDIWNWKDPLLQTMQARQGGALTSRTLTYAFHVDDGRIVQLNQTPQERVRMLTPDGSRALITDSAPYAQEVSWDGRYSDYYVVNTLDGSRQKVAEHQRGAMGSSPDGRYLMSWDGTDWHCMDLVSNTKVNLTGAVDVAFQREDWDTPQQARAYGVAGWTEGEKRVLIYDRHDIWSFDPAGGSATCVTDGLGRQRGLEFRIQQLDSDMRFVPTEEPVLLATRNLETMATGYWRDRVAGLGKPELVTMKDMRFSSLSKAKDADRMFFTLSTWANYPNVWTSGPDFADAKQITDLKPQKDVRWGSSELVSWKSLDGKPLKGILVKPDGFDPNKKYPLMVYFYEKRSANVHSYVTPRPGTSPNAAYYVSNGYVWFEPDIVYRDGYPGDSCLKCLVPGVQHLVAQGFIDEDAIGAAGHSWGGYQTAYLITQTDIFACVESGAPVSNMTSAYGGIRWSSGMNRAFQYERTQSRIGGTLWRYPMRYLENSPVFAADKVNTPILMLHNDEDGAVPWYQGIEYFCALRRLGKEVYMLNYNGAGHGLSKRQDTMDWTMRMQQYFDHHLRGKPMPKWMAQGVPYHERMREKIEFNEPNSVKVRRERKAAAEAIEIGETSSGER